jgi:hypothetical protein
MNTYIERVSSAAPRSIATVAAASVLVLAQNPARRYACICNDSDAVMYLALYETAEAHKGIRLSPNGGVYEMNYLNYYTGPIAVYCASAGKNISYVEG